METIHLTPETYKQYRADCLADSQRKRKERLAEEKHNKATKLKHDTEFVGKFIFVPDGYLKERLTKFQIRQLVALHG